VSKKEIHLLWSNLGTEENGSKKENYIFENGSGKGDFIFTNMIKRHRYMMILHIFLFFLNHDRLFFYK